MIVVSALKGITDFLIESMQQALVDESSIPDIMNRYRNRHAEVGRHLIQDKPSRRLCKETLAGSFSQLERLLYGLSFTREITPRLYDTIVSFGERTCAELLAAVMNSRGIASLAAMPQEIGLLTDGKFGDATADLTYSITAGNGGGVASRDRTSATTARARRWKAATERGSVTSSRSSR